MFFFEWDSTICLLRRAYFEGILHAKDFGECCFRGRIVQQILDDVSNKEAHATTNRKTNSLYISDSVTANSG
jgi:hypothetical protein